MNDATDSRKYGGFRRAAAAWWLAVRPRTLGASLVPVAVGVAFASRTRDVDAAVAVLTAVAALALQIASNLANDYYDFASGIDTEARLGPRRAAASGLLDPRAVKFAAFASCGVGAVAGVALVAVGGPTILAIGVVAIVAALAYSAGPAPLASFGLGELLAFLFFGVVAVCGSALLQGAVVDAHLVVVSLPVAALVTAIMVVNNLRDISTDAATGKRTLAVRLGDRGTRGLYAGLVAGAFAVLPAVGVTTAPGALLSFALAPLAYGETVRLWRRSGAELNLSLAGTARLHLLFGVAYIVGLTI